VATGAPSGGSGSGSGSVAPTEFSFSFSGSLTTEQDNLIPKLVAGFEGNLAVLGVALQEAPTGTAAIFTFKKNGSSIGIVTVAAGDTEAETALSPVEPFVAGDIFSVEITQVGSLFRGTTASMYARTG